MHQETKHYCCQFLTKDCLCIAKGGKCQFLHDNFIPGGCSRAHAIVNAAVHTQNCETMVKHKAPQVIILLTLLTHFLFLLRGYSMQIEL